MKTCTKCGISKSQGEFYRCKSFPDGLQYHCKQCQDGARKIHRKNNPERTREVGRLGKRRQREREGDEETCRKWNEWYANNKEHRRAYQYARNDPIRYRAYRTVAYALKVGWLVKPDHCPECGEEREVIAHHEDYEKPREIDWLCRKCHSLAHDLVII